MRGFREIREAQRPGNTSKEVRFSEDAMRKYNSLFVEDECDAAYNAYKPQIMEEKRALVAEPRECSIPKNLHALDPHVVEEVAAHVSKKNRSRAYKRKISSDELIESTKRFIENHMEEAEKGYCEPFYSALFK